ncbi:hypothetical protein [Pedobacter sp.]|uniref:hypothetical protein n=1 Tax=Pedobacter sp. TaxID=1411316 RepID=UPI003BA8F70F
MMEIGPFGVILAIFFLCQLFHRELYGFNSLVYWAISLPFLFIEIHNTRGDKGFVNIYFKQSFFIFTLEYLLLCIPLLAPMVLYGAYFHVIVVFTSIIVAPVFPMKFKNVHIIPTIFPRLSLDWINGLRTSYLRFVVLFVAALAGAFVNNIKVVEAAICISFILSTDFNTEFEPSYYLLQYSGQPVYTLIRIVGSSLISFLIFNSPFLIVLLLASEHDLELFLRMAGAIIVLHLLLLLLKYTVYRAINHLSYTLLKIFLLSLVMISFYNERLEYLMLIPLLFLFALKRITRITYG